MPKRQLEQLITVLVWAYIIVAALLSVVAAFVLESRLKRRLPNTKPFKWGYYVGSTGVACLPLAALCLLGALVNAAANDWGNFSEMLGYAAWLAVCGVSGLFMIWRKRWAWIVGTILSCNPAWWFTNWIYVRNRWHEFAAEAAPAGNGAPVARVEVGSLRAPEPPPQPPPVIPLSVGLPSHSLYIHLNGEPKGPFTVEQLKALLAVQTITHETPCCHDGAEAWQTVGAYLA